MRIQKINSLSFLLIFLCFGMTSCEYQPDLEMIKNSNCAAPCWNGITPGASSGDEAMARLVEMKGVKHDTVKRNVASQYLFQDQIYWDFENGSFGNISVANGVVAEIRLGKVKARLMDLIDIFGTPEHIMFLPFNGSEWKTNILYVRQGIWLYYVKAHTKDGKIINIQPNDKVEDITFFSSAVYNDLIINSTISYIKQQSLQLENIIQPWNGYQEEMIIQGK